MLLEDLAVLFMGRTSEDPDRMPLLLRLCIPFTVQEAPYPVSVDLLSPYVYLSLTLNSAQGSSSSAR